MRIKAPLPLIATLKFKDHGHLGEHLGQEIAQVYKACKKERLRHMGDASNSYGRPAKPASVMPSQSQGADVSLRW